MLRARLFAPAALYALRRAQQSVAVHQPVGLAAGALLVACEQFGAANDAAKALISIAKEKNIPVYTEVSQVPLTGSEAQNEG